MRHNFAAFLGTLVFAAAFFGASAFTAMNTGARTVTATVVGDSAAYVAVAVNGSSPDKNFVTVSNGQFSISFGTVAGITGTGVNPGSGYYFDDLLNLTNQGSASLKIQVNTTATTGALDACVQTVGGLMQNSCYVTSTAAQTVAVGGTLSIGIEANATGLNSGQSVSGSVSIVANR